MSKGFCCQAMDKLCKSLTDLDKRIQISTAGEVRRIQHSLERILRSILDVVQRKDHRLQGCILPVGSYYSDLKIGLPDEFDFLYELHSLQEGINFVLQPSGFKGSRNLWRTPRGDPGKRKILLKTPECYKSAQDSDESENWLYSTNGKRSEVRENEFVLHPVGVKNTFYYAVLEVIRSMDQSKFPRYLSIDRTEEATFYYGPAVTLFFVWNGRFYKNLKITVDLTVCVRAAQWEDQPPILKSEHLNPESCLSALIHEETSRRGFHLVPHVSDRGHVQWKVSTSYLETKIFARFHKDASLKRIIRIVKFVKDQNLKHRPDLTLLNDPLLANCVRFYNFYAGKDYDENFKNMVSSFMIKNVVMNVCGSASSSEWKNASISTLYLLTLVFLYKTLAYGTLENFFLPDLKLNIPEFGDILPGFHKIFSETDKMMPSENVRNNNEEETLLDKPFCCRGAVTIFKSTKKHIDLHYRKCWQS